MYLAQCKIRGKVHYIIRESYQDGNRFLSRNLFDIGSDPADYIIYPGGNAFYIDERVSEELADRGVMPTPDELDDLFWPFVHPTVQRSSEPFRSRAAKARRKTLPSAAEQEKLAKQTHEFDKRRLHFLKCGTINQRNIHAMPFKMIRNLVEKSRDELEQLFIQMEQELEPVEYKNYVYTIFNLQRFFTGKIALKMPEGLDQNLVEAHLIEELCRLNRSKSFWNGLQSSDALHEYLVRYAIMFFDNEYASVSPMREYIEDFMNRHRFHRPLPPKKTVTLDKAAEIFGITEKQLKTITKKGLIRRYRRMAHNLHPDKQSGSHEKFIELNDAFQELLIKISSMR